MAARPDREAVVAARLPIEADVAGRYCPAHYGYAPAGFARTPDFAADTLIVVGGLYGNLAALDAAEALLAAEAGDARLVFNGDFHWFDVDPDNFAAGPNHSLSLAAGPSRKREVA